MNLIIGNTSQLSYYFPDDYLRISSRNIDFNFLKSRRWQSVYITFAEQNMWKENVDFVTPNFVYTMEIVEKLVDISDKIVVYTSCELWNNYQGMIKLDDRFSYNYPNDYTLSKEMLVNRILELRAIDNKFNKIKIIHPFRFDSVHRRKEFLFGKIFDSIINKKQIEIGDTYFYRDMVHAKYMVNRSIESVSDEMVGSGQLFLVGDFIKDLYSYFKMDYNFYVKEHKNKNTINEYYPYQDTIYRYEDLFNDTVEDIKKYLR